MLQADATPSAAVSLTEDERVHAVSGLLQEKGEPGTHESACFRKEKKQKNKQNRRQHCCPGGGQEPEMGAGRGLVRF